MCPNGRYLAFSLRNLDLLVWAMADSTTTIYQDLVVIRDIWWIYGSYMVRI